MIKHYLYHVDLERRIAFCSACGSTEVYVTKSRAESTPRVSCINRVRETRQAENRHRKEQRSLKQGRKPRHSLSDIDVEKMTAICAVCGPTDIQKRTVKQATLYLCAVKQREAEREYRRIHYTPRSSKPLAHTLFEIDEKNKTAVCSQCGPVQIYMWQGKKKIGRRCSNATVERIIPAQQIRQEINTEIINEHKVKHGCQRCVYNASPIGLYLHARNPDEKDPEIEKVLMLRRDLLVQKLEKTVVFCAICHHLVQKERESKG